jgi:hypothetical protein
MKFDSPCFFQTLTILAVGKAMIDVSSLHAQEVSSIINGQLESGEVIDVIVPRETARRGGLELGAVVSAAYSNNIFLSSTNPTADMVFKLGPSIAYTQGDRKEGEGGYLRGAYQPMGVLYARGKADNRIDQSAAIETGWRGKISKVTFEGVLQKLGDATADTGTQTERLESQSEIRGAWMVREKVTLEAAVGAWQTRYQNLGLVDSGQIYGEIAARYAYSPKTELGASYRLGSLKIEGEDSQTVQQLTGRMVWLPREKIEVKIDAGAEIRDYGQGTNVSPVVNARLGWTPRAGTRLYFSAFQRQQVSALNQGQIYESKGLTAGGVQRLGGNWLARIDLGYEISSYLSDGSTGAASREDKIWFVRPALNYQFSDQLDGSLYYEVSDNNSTDPSFGYSAATTGIEINYKF